MKSDLKKSKYDLEFRTKKFSNSIIGLCKLIEKNSITKPLISQIIRSATSVGANYTEANNACSKKDFRNKIYICKKEICETKYWLLLLKENKLTSLEDDINLIHMEANELTLIFGKIISSLKNNSKLKNS